MSTALSEQLIRRLLKDAVDREFYHSRYDDVRQAGSEPAEHYREHGWRERRDPAPWFSTAAYLEQHDWLEAAGTNPLIHFLTHGTWAPAALTRADEPSVRAAAGIDDPADLVSEPAALGGERQLIATAFDAEFYIERYPEAARAGLDPLDHFMEQGWRAGNDPNSNFSTRDYGISYPDVVSAGVNPIYHYLAHGRAEGRSPREWLGFRASMLRHRPSPRSSPPMPAPMLSRDDLASRLAVLAGASELHIDIGQDWPAQPERSLATGAQRSVDRLRLSHVHGTGDSVELFEIELNGRRLGTAGSAVLLDALERVGTVGTPSFTIHRLAGPSVDAVAAFLQALGCRAGVYRVGDYAAACSQPLLLRNDVQFCGGPPPGSPACSVCRHGRTRAEQMAAHRRLFAAFDLTAIAPSRVAAEIWESATGGLATVAVKEPLGTKPRARPPRHQPRGSLLRVALLGAATPEQGSELFRELRRSVAEDPHLDFLQIAPTKLAGSGIGFVAADTPQRILEVVEREQIDVALNLSLWPEPLSWAARGAVAGGAALVALADSGDAAVVAAETGGVVIHGEADLKELFQGDGIARLARVRRTVRLSRLTEPDD